MDVENGVGLFLFLVEAEVLLERREGFVLAGQLVLPHEGAPLLALIGFRLGLDAGQVGWGGARQEITDVRQAEERKAGEKIEDEGDAHERIVAFLEQLKVI